jgi:hypothetical protein
MNNVSLTSERLLITANVVPSTPIVVTLMIEVLCSSETSAPTRDTRRNITKVGILHSHRRENLKSYKPWASTASFEASSAFHLGITAEFTQK